MYILDKTIQITLNYLLILFLCMILPVCRQVFKTISHFI